MQQGINGTRANDGLLLPDLWQDLLRLLCRLQRWHGCQVVMPKLQAWNIFTNVMGRKAVVAILEMTRI